MPPLDGRFLRQIKVTTLIKMKPLLKSALPVLFFPFLLLNPQQSKAEGGCPNGLFPVGGGYCRNIVCVEGSFDSSTIPVMKKYGAICPGREFLTLLAHPDLKDSKHYGGSWGNMMIPMRK
jgi:hypothetical protein